MYRIRLTLFILAFIGSNMLVQASAQDVRKTAYMDNISIKAYFPGQDGSIMYASSVSVLEFFLRYDGLSKNAVSVHLLYKLIRPNGSIALLSDMDAYSGETDFLVQPKKDHTAILATIPSTRIAPLLPGEYSFELWCEGRLISTLSFALHKKPQEATYLTVDKNEYTFSGEGETVNFVVDTDAEEWSARGFPSWCTIVRSEGNSLRVRASSNISQSLRFDVVFVDAGDSTAAIKFYQPSAFNELMSDNWRRLLDNAMKSEAKEFDQGLYEGEWADGPNGSGIYLNRNGTVYVGEWKDGKRDGYGVLLHSSDPSAPFLDGCSFFSGYWNDNEQDGVCVGFDQVGTPVFAGGYSGGVRDDQMDEDIDEYNRIRFASIEQGASQYYVGETKDGIPDGYGMLLIPNGDIWCGEWKSGVQTENGYLIAYQSELNEETLNGEGTERNASKRSRRKKTKDDVNTHIASLVLDVMPSFHDGNYDDFTQWVSDHIQYPSDANLNQITGTVELSFTVSATGEITDVTVILGVYPSLDAEAIRVVKSSPRWSPGILKDHPVPVTYTFPVNFTLHPLNSF